MHTMAAERVTTAVNELVREVVLAAVREELAAHKEEVDELRHMLTAVKGGLAAVKEELAAVRGELARHKELWAESSNRSLDVCGVGGKSRKRTQDMRLEFAREDEGAEVQELCWPRDSEGLTACKDRQMTQDLKIRQSEGDHKTAWLAIDSASTSHIPMLNLQYLHSLSDAMLGHVSTMTHLKSVDLSSSSCASAEGIKHLYRLQRLEKLNFSKSDVLDSALEGIGSLTTLKQLLLSFTKVTDAGLLHLTGLSSLQLLSLTECMGVTNASMVNVGRLTGLEELWLGGTAVTDDGLQQLTALTKLVGLWTPEEDYRTFETTRFTNG